MTMAKTKELLPMDRCVCVSRGVYVTGCNSHSSVWPMFFHKSLWNEVTQMTQIISTVVRLCVSIADLGESDEHASSESGQVCLASWQTCACHEPVILMSSLHHLPCCSSACLLLQIVHTKQPIQQPVSKEILSSYWLESVRLVMWLVKNPWTVCVDFQITWITVCLTTLSCRKVTSMCINLCFLALQWSVNGCEPGAFDFLSL